MALTERETDAVLNHIDGFKERSLALRKELDGLNDAIEKVRDNLAALATDVRILRIETEPARKAINWFIVIIVGGVLAALLALVLKS